MNGQARRKPHREVPVSKPVGSECMRGMVIQEHSASVCKVRVKSGVQQAPSGSQKCCGQRAAEKGWPRPATAAKVSFIIAQLGEEK